MDSKMSHIYKAQSYFMIKIREERNNAAILMNFNSTVLRKRNQKQKNKRLHATQFY